jgi:DNA-binding transcriptional LysR family regulator
MADKKRTDADWDDLRVFLALARHGSLSATARALRVNHATIARRVASLEATLGRALFERRADGYPLTAAGRAILADAARMEEAALSAARGGEAHGVSGVVRISATPSLAEGFLAPRLAAWSARQPGLEIELVGDVAARSLARRAIDIALRLSPPEGAGLVARKAARIGYAIYAAPALRERIAGGEAPRFAGFDEANSRLPEAAWLRRAFPAAALAVRCNTLIGQAAAARSGAVAALLPHFLVVGDASLAPVALQRAPPSRDLWLGTRADPSEASAIAAVAGFLFETLTRERALFSGR